MIFFLFFYVSNENTELYIFKAYSKRLILYYLLFHYGYKGQPEHYFQWETRVAKNYM